MAIFQLILKVEAELPVNEMQAVREGVKDGSPCLGLSTYKEQGSHDLRWGSHRGSKLG